MKKLDHQLQRLLRAVGTVERPAVTEPGQVPDARDLLRRRERELAHTEIVTRQVFRVGLATACLLLMVTLLVSVRHLRLMNEDVFTVSEVVLTRISTP